MSRLMDSVNRIVGEIDRLLDDQPQEPRQGQRPVFVLLDGEPVLVEDFGTIAAELGPDSITFRGIGQGAER